VATLAFGGWGAEPTFMTAFRLTATVAILSYCLATIPGTIWFGYSWRSQGLYIMDGILYGAATGAVFAWLWPSAEALAPALPAVGG
ncbi:MAG: hypothetical protein ACYS5V_14120, partial [Planctomycetota bacterium]